MAISHVNNPSSSMSPRPDYQVFLSFRGPDTRRNFADFLYTSLTDVGIHVFRDEEELERGKEINHQLIQAVKQSKISIPVISEDYASSKSCLMELDQMVSRTDNKNRIIIPVFYYVNPSDVRHCTGPFENALNEHKKHGRDDSILNPWKSALQRIGCLKGHHLHENQEKTHGEFIKLIVGEVEQMLRTRDLMLPKQLVGVDPHVQEIMAKLKVDYCSGEAVKIGDTCEKVLLIHGIPGVGKTVLAKCVYNKLNHLFDACSFLKKVQEEIRDHNIVSVQNRLISHIHKGNAQKFDCSDLALTHIRDRFRAMKVLLLLDDVKDHEQLSALVGELDWLGPGSTVIVTSRRCDVLQKVKGAKNYVLRTMQQDEALTLFCRHAFETDSPREELKELATDIVAATHRLPLVLEKVGEFLLGKGKRVWSEKLIQLKAAPDKSVQDALLESYTTLDEKERQIFLDIACFFNGTDKRIPYYMWDDLQFSPKISIISLCAMSLVEIGEDKELRMWGILKAFGREIVKSENENEPCQRSRLWNHRDALDALKEGKGTKKVEALGLKFANKSERNISFRCGKFDGLQNLRFLELDRADIQGNFEDPFWRLRWLGWQGTPAKFDIESLNLKLQHLVILDLSGSRVYKEWKGWQLLSTARKLKVLKLTGCAHLSSTPIFPAFLRLERLILEGCSNLAVIDSSICNLEELVSLNMKGCGLLSELPDLGPMRSLKELVIDGTFISRINVQEGSMRNLKFLSARNCENLTEISDSIKYSKSLKYLSLDGSKIGTSPALKNRQRLTNLPDGIGRPSSPQSLHLSGTATTGLPTSVDMTVRQESPETTLNLENPGERIVSSILDNPSSPPRRRWNFKRFLSRITISDILSRRRRHRR